MATILSRPVDDPTWTLIRTMLVFSRRSTGASTRSLAGHAFVIVLNGAIAALVSTLALQAILSLEDQVLRRRLLIAISSLVTLSWSFAQVVLQKHMNYLLDIRPLLILPFGFRKLYRLRLAGSLGGWWIVGLGPAVCYVALGQSSGVADAAALLAAVVLAVLLQGQLGSILCSQRDRLVGGPLGSAAMLLGMIAMYLILAHGAAVATGDVNAQDVANLIRESPLVTAAAYTPAGLVAGILDQPSVRWPTIARLSGLLLYFAGLASIDRLLLSRSCFGRPLASSIASHRTLPLALILRRVRSLSPAACLTLIEIESAARCRALRWCFLIAVAFLVVGTGDPVLGVVGPLTLACLFLNIQRAERLLPTCRVWRESFVLPVPLLKALRAMGKGSFLATASFAGAAVLVSTGRYGFVEWPLIVLSVGFAAAMILAADGGYGWYDTRWQSPPETVGKDLRGGKSLAQNILGLSLVGLGAAFTVLYSSSEAGPTAPVAGVATFSVLVVAALTRRMFRWRQERLMDSQGLDRLLGRPTDPAPPDQRLKQSRSKSP